MKRPLRAFLRDSTKSIHDRLDAGVSANDLLRRDDYIRFLASQLSAREPIERWAEHNVSSDTRPPQTSLLLRQDLAELEAEPTGSEGAGFFMPEGADPLGMAWAIAGSQMGNKSMLKWLRKVGNEQVRLPVRFLSDTRMDEFWHAILPRLKEETSEDAAGPAIMAALAVFERFEDAFGTNGTESAAA